MKVRIQQPIKNNYVIDASGIGIKQFDFAPQNLGLIIEDDLQSNFNCITYITTSTQAEEDIHTSTSNKAHTHLNIRLFFKTRNCTDKDSMMGVIESYLAHAFVK